MIGRGFRHDAEAFFVDHFFDYSTGRWPTLTNDGASGTVAVSSTAGKCSGGVLAIPTTAQTNDYQLLSTAKCFEFLANKPVFAEAKFLLTENAANSAHWCFGFTDTLTTGWLTATTGAPPASYKGAMIWKPATAANVNFETANGTTKNTTSSGYTFTSGTALHLGVSFDPGDGTTGFVQFWFQQQGSDTKLKVVKRLPITLSGLAPMTLSIGLMASSANVETLYVDYVAAKAVI